MLLTITRCKIPVFVDSAGPRSRLLNRMNIGAETMFRIVMFVIVTPSNSAPATVSSASPWHPSKMQFEIVMFLNPPFDSVPSLMRPVCGTLTDGSNFFQVPSSMVPSS